MERKRSNLPSLGALAVFDAAARHMSFTAAARELNVTQAAVSKRMKQLEEELGLSLFRRSGRSLSLTESGGSTRRWITWKRAAPGCTAIAARSSRSPPTPRCRISGSDRGSGNTPSPSP